MEFIVCRAYEGGRLMQKHLMWASETRGTIVVKEERDPERHRTVRVARLTPGSGQRPIPPLYDVALVGCNGDLWTLTGFERIASGPVQQEHLLGQTWQIKPGAIADLERAEREWKRLAAELKKVRSTPKSGGDGA